MRARLSLPPGWKVTLLAVLLALVLSAGVSAAPHPKVPDWGAIQLENVGDEPLASGVATLTNVRQVDGWFYDDGWGPVYWGATYAAQLSVTCDNLNPGAVYSTPAGTFQADRRRGTGTVKAWVTFEIQGSSWPGWGGRDVSPFRVMVDRLNPDGSSTTVLVGCFYGAV